MSFEARFLGHLVATHGSVFGRVVFLNFLCQRPDSESVLRMRLYSRSRQPRADLGLGLVFWDATKLTGSIHHIKLSWLRLASAASHGDPRPYLADFEFSGEKIYAYSPLVTCNVGQTMS